MWFYGIYLKLNSQVFKSQISWTGLLPVDWTVDRCKSRSTGLVDRRAQACMPAWAGGPIDRAVDRPESSALWKWPRSTGRSTGRELSLYPVPIDRAVDRPESRSLCFQVRSTGGTTVIKMTVGRSTGRSFLTFPTANGQNLFWAINIPHLSWF